LNKRELTRIKKDINNLCLIDIDKKACSIFLELLTKYALSNKLAVPDGLIAATAIAWDIELFTLNHKDYRFIDGLRLF
jgi:tRNA(fMet)-specific endonuclease VapC